MDDIPSKNTDTKPTGRSYATVDDLLKGEFPTEITEGVRKLSAETHLTRVLAALRVKAGLTQEALAEKMNPVCTQGTISKLEAGRDEDLTLAEIREYSRVLNERIGICFGPQQNHVEAIKAHALAMKRHMLDLTRIAQQDGEMEREIQAFFGDAFFNILSILATCQGSMPGKGPVEFRFEVIEPAAGKRASRKESRQPVLA